MNTQETQTDLVEDLERLSRREQFERAFFALHEGRAVCLATVGEVNAFRDGNIEFFKKAAAVEAESRARYRAGVSAGDKDGQYAYSDLPKLEAAIEQITSEKKRFREKLRYLVSELAECDRRVKASEKALAEAEAMTGYDKRVTIQDAEQNIAWVAGYRADLEKRKTKNEAWLAAEVEKERLFPAEELKKLRSLRRALLRQY